MTRMTEGLQVVLVVRATEAVSLSHSWDDVVDLKLPGALTLNTPVPVSALGGVLGAAPDVVVVEGLSALVGAVLASSLG